MKKILWHSFATAILVVAMTGLNSCSNKKFNVSGTINGANDSTLYFENMSLLLDFQILVRTVYVVLTGKGAQ